MPPNIMQQSANAAADKGGSAGGKTAAQEPVDTVALRGKIKQELGDEKFNAYWKVLRTFIVAKINKQELDYHVHRIMGPQAASWHNKLMSAIVFNAQENARSVPLDIKKISIKPDVIKDATRKRKNAPTVTDDDTPLKPARKPKKPKVNKATAAAAAAAAAPTASTVTTEPEKPEAPAKPKPRRKAPADSKGTAAAAAAAAKEVKPAVKKDGPVALLGKKSHVTPFVKAEETAESCSQALELPDFLTLKRRMLKCAQDNNLMYVTDESVSLVMKALEQRLKDIMEKCTRVVKPRTLADVQTRKSAMQNSPVNITSRSLTTALNLAPYLLGDDVVMNQERSLILQTLGLDT